MANAQDVRKKRHISLIIRVVVAIVAILLAFRGLNWGKLAEVFQRLNLWYFVLSLVVFAAAQVIIAVRWWLLLRAQSIHISVLAAVRLFFLGLFYNNVMPGAVGGDLLKAWYVAKHTDKRLEGVLSVVVDRAIGLFGLIIMAVFTGSVFVPGGILNLVRAMDAGTPAPAGRCGRVILWVGLLLVAAAAAVVIHPYSRRALRKAVERAWARGLGLLQRVNSAILLYCSRPWTLLAALILTFISQSVVIAAFWLLGRNLGMEAEWKYYFVVFPVMWVVAALPISIAGLGILEGGIRFMFESLTGAVAAEAVVLAFCQRFVWILASLPGGLVHLLGGHLPREICVDSNEHIN